MSERAATGGGGSRAEGAEGVEGGTGLPGLGAAGALLLCLAASFWLAGAFQPEGVPSYASSARQIIGMALMLTLIPPYLVGAASLGQRRSLALVDEARALLEGPGVADDAAATIRSGLRRTWIPGTAAGLLMGLMNTAPLEALQSEVPWVAAAISMGQLVMWWVIGLLLGVRITSARAFRRLAEAAELDLFRPERLRPVARSGVIDVVIIAGALLLTPLQSIDAEFRWYNYTFGLAVALPAAAFFLVWPLRPLRRRNRADRDARLAAIDAQLQALGPEPATTPEASIRLEALLAHRDRIRGAPTLPISTALLSRALLYLVIPPLAWAGAAVVERVVDSLLGG